MTQRSAFGLSPVSLSLITVVRAGFVSAYLTTLAAFMLSPASMNVIIQVVIEPTISPDPVHEFTDVPWQHLRCQVPGFIDLFDVDAVPSNQFDPVNARGHLRAIALGIPLEVRDGLRALQLAVSPAEYFFLGSPSDTEYATVSGPAGRIRLEEEILSAVPGNIGAVT